MTVILYVKNKYLIFVMLSPVSKVMLIFKQHTIKK